MNIPQAYVELGVEDWSVKIGHFYTIIGYEVVTAPDNFFMTHAYTMQYGEPFTHTGALITKKVNDQLSLIGGITTGWDNFDNVYNNEYSFLGGRPLRPVMETASWHTPRVSAKKKTLFGTVFPTETRFIQSIVYSRTITDRLNYVFQSDYGINKTPKHIRALKTPRGTASTSTCSTRSIAAGRPVCGLNGSATTTAGVSLQLATTLLRV